MNLDFIFQPFVLLRLNLSYQNMYYDDHISEKDFKSLSSLTDKIIEIMPQGKIANMYRELYKTNETDEILHDIERHSDYDVNLVLDKYLKNFTENYCLSIDQQISKHLIVFGELVDGLYKLHLEQKELVKTIGEKLNA